MYCVYYKLLSRLLLHPQDEKGRAWGLLSLTSCGASKLEEVLLQGKHLYGSYGRSWLMAPTEEDMGGLEPWAVGRGNIAGHSVMEADHQTHTVS